MGTLGLLLVLVAVGAAWGDALGGSRSRPARWLMFLVAGLVHLHLASLLLTLFGFPHGLGGLAAGLLAQGLAVRVALRVALRTTRPAPPRSRRQPGIGWGEALATLPVLVLGALAAGGRPVMSDYVYHWGAKARRLHATGAVDFEWLAGDWNRHLHADYPDLLPHLYAWTARLAGGWSDPQMLAWSAIFFVGLLVAVREAVLRGLRRDDAAQLWIAVPAFGVGAFALGHRMGGAADWVLALGLAAAVPDLVGARRDRSGDLRIGLLAAVVASAKIEGVVLGAGLVAGRWLAARDPAPGSIPRAVRLCGPAAAVVLPWLYLSHRWGLFDGSELGGLRIERWNQVVATLFSSRALDAWHGFWWILLGVPLLLLRRRLRIAAAVILLQLAFYLAVYLSAPLDTARLVQFSAARLALHLVPATWILLGLALRPRWRVMRSAVGAPEPESSPETWDSGVRGDPLEEEWSALVRSRDLVRLWTSRNLTLRYKRSVLGVVWTLIEPLAVISILVVVFSTVFRFDVPDYPIYLLPGWLAWDFFAKATQAMSANAAEGVDLTTHLDAPRSAFVVAALFTHLVNWVIASGVMVAVLLVLGRRPGPEWLAVPAGMAILALFALGIGFLVATLHALFRDFGPLYQLALTVWLYATPLIYPVEILPEKVRPFFLLNPLAHLVELVRGPFYLGTVPRSGVWLASATFALGAFFVGWWTFCRARDQVTLRA